MMNSIFRKINIIASSAVLLLGTVSCLDKYPQSAIPEDEAMKTFSDAEQLVTGIYASFKSSALYGGYLTLLPDIQSDFVYAVNGFSNTYGKIWQWNIKTTDDNVEAVFGSLYYVIGKCNFYLDQIDGLKASLTDDESLEYIDYYTGEVYCARALAYSELLKLFCKAYDPQTAASEQGLVLKDTYFGEGPSGRASLKDSYQFVLDDLAKAEEMLDEENDSYNSYYFTNAAAKALHARVALYMQDWDAAVKYSTEVIESGSFALADGAASFSSDYTYLEYLWRYDSSYEIIWRVGYTTTSYGGPLGRVFLGYTGTGYFYPDYVPAQWVLNLFSSADGRYDAYFDSSLPVGYSHGLSWPLLTKFYGNPNFWSIRLYHYNMPKPLRLSEQYLIRAEAYCRQSSPNYSAASKDLTALQSKRNVTGSGSVTVGAGNWLEVIGNERVKELYMEGFRLHDLKRWNKGFERTPQTESLAEGSSLKVDADNPLFVWPVPQHEIEAPGSPYAE
ncbi:MAG: RagB/SusD family nutrient uptake outer membrane protein [Candidatus Cryptobacteroides sp.]